MIKFNPTLCDMVMRLEDELPYKDARKATRKFVSQMSEEEKKAILGGEDELTDNMVEEQLQNKEILMNVGFTEDEAGDLMDKRLGTPGMKNLVAMRAEEIKEVTRLFKSYRVQCEKVAKSTQTKLQANPSHSRRFRDDYDVALRGLQNQLRQKFDSLGTTLDFEYFEEWLRIRPLGRTSQQPKESAKKAPWYESQVDFTERLEAWRNRR